MTPLTGSGPSCKVRKTNCVPYDTLYTYTGGLVCLCPVLRSPSIKAFKSRAAVVMENCAAYSGIRLMPVKQLAHSAPAKARPPGLCSDSSTLHRRDEWPVPRWSGIRNSKPGKLRRKVGSRL